MKAPAHKHSPVCLQYAIKATTVPPELPVCLQSTSSLPPVYLQSTSSLPPVYPQSTSSVPPVCLQSAFRLPPVCLQCATSAISTVTT